ncbi:uncharacterized protein BDR25DRAFT_343840 [Lindgomyces ingoldianus]|uniref:Uncharacterized protein n=1 Tax=Lindgomyces ingoldianus TaxID=673940 RepID=A0ACB6QSB0_9PLEO|nr:uncharacterized protein BDR25DRAFT_343840 [Lindgomyces ingoldianus]KAF2468995.1 hypothetical protein BDR25DRAFT_343840 [Lindgomyces ingoldianus]
MAYLLRVRSTRQSYTRKSAIHVFEKPLSLQHPPSSLNNPLTSHRQDFNFHPPSSKHHLKEFSFILLSEDKIQNNTYISHFAKYCTQLHNATFHHHHALLRRPLYSRSGNKHKHKHKHTHRCSQAKSSRQR